MAMLSSMVGFLNRLKNDVEVGAGDVMKFIGPEVLTLLKTVGTYAEQEMSQRVLPVVEKAAEKAVDDGVTAVVNAVANVATKV